jgi:hypothetical protein
MEGRKLAAVASGHCRVDVDVPGRSASSATSAAVVEIEGQAGVRGARGGRRDGMDRPGTVREEILGESGQGGVQIGIGVPAEERAGRGVASRPAGRRGDHELEQGGAGGKPLGRVILGAGA